MKKLMMGMAAACAMLTVGAANTYYVDAVNGNDSYDGLAAAWDGEHGPIRTLANITNLVTATTKEKTVGDTVYVAEGDYNFGSDATGKYRAAVTNGVRLVGVGDRNKIRVFGSATDAKAQADENSMRCLRVGKWALVKNMTLCNGRGYDVSGGCAAVEATAFVVGCVVSNNYVKKGPTNQYSGRGGAFSGGTVIRCLLVKNAASELGTCMNSGCAWNSVFYDNGTSYPIYQGAAYNCTIVGGGALHDTNWNNSYNLLGITGGTEMSNAKHYYWYSLFACAINAEHLKDGSLDNVDKDDLQIDAHYEPVYGANLGIDHGTNGWYEANFPSSALVADQKYLDFNGNPRIVGGTIDAGACEYDPAVRTLTITDAQTALVVTGAAKGETVLRKGATNTFTLARNYSTAKLCTGVRVNGEFFSFTGDNADRTYEYTYGYGDPTAALMIEAVYAEHNDWYVDAVNGNDANNGYTSYQKKRTLAGALGNALVASGDVVHAAPGVYNEGLMYDSSGCSNRVVLASGVKLVGDEGAGVTTIEGKPSELPTTLGQNGLDSMRAVYMEDDSILKGFTVTKGLPPTDANRAGGGIIGKGLCVECRVVDNKSSGSGRGDAAASGTTFLRSYIGKNRSGSFCVNGTIRFVECVYDTTVTAYASCSAYDTTFLKGCVRSTGAETVHAYNCVVLTSQSGDRPLAFHGCILCFAQSGKMSDPEDNCQFGVSADALPYDPTTYRPTIESLALNKGTDYRHLATNGWSEAWQAEYMDKDFAGGQRIYNGQIDVGCGEYDWRGEYTRKLGTRRAEVTAATAEVELVGDALTVGAGGTLTFRVTLAAQGGRVSFTAGGTVKVGGETLTPVEGVYSFIGTASTSYVVTVTAADAPVTVSAVTVPKRGIVVVIK